MFVAFALRRSRPLPPAPLSKWPYLHVFEGGLVEREWLLELAFDSVDQRSACWMCGDRYGLAPDRATGLLKIGHFVCYVGVVLHWSTDGEKIVAVIEQDDPMTFEPFLGQDILRTAQSDNR